MLRFFAFFDRYRHFEHSVRDFLNEYMEDANQKFDEARGAKLFQKTCRELATLLPDSIRRATRKGTTPLNLFEGVTVGAALAIQQNGKLEKKDIRKWMASPELLEFTTQATNDKRNVVGRIEYCRNKFMGE